ncbi:uncharacterized protein LOC108622627 [Ceratina calcarata]|uniref:Uncharacterized protein LOC108622627 n=1 Tax=Ceratina calcarata TaxID=156304 RepID=A0AAJ7ITK3_9HYME|nr:uncharacterized protein LOC108622627 [Ceratina calcarata]
MKFISININKGIIMSSENNLKLQVNYNMIRTVEEEVIKVLQKEDYTLNTVNIYGENLLHVSAANGCLEIVKEILRNPDASQIIDRKNKFGWTPLMLAIRNRNIKTVKYLLEKHANVNESTYLGMSIIGLAAAINKDMFEILYEACPAALLKSIDDDITPLCIAAMKNDKNLFFRLIELGFDVSKNNNYTDIMIKQSIVPEIRRFGKQHLDVEDYWNDSSDNIPQESESYEIKFDTSALSDINIPMFKFDTVKSNADDGKNNLTKVAKRLLEPCMLDVPTNESLATEHSLISPTLTHLNTLNEILPAPPNIYFTKSGSIHEENVNTASNIEIEGGLLIKKVNVHEIKNNSTQSSLQRLQSVRPSDIIIQNPEEDLDTTLGYVPDFSPLRSPNIPPDMNDENVFGEDTPTPPHYRTPPRGIRLNSQETKMCALLKHYGLGQHVPIFLQEEIDIDLFVTLTNEDLIEIGIKNEEDREAILNAINDYNKLMV